MLRNRYYIFIIVFTLMAGTIFMVNYNRKYNTIYGDAMGYYLYLPSLFIYQNLQDIDSLPADEHLNSDLYTYTGNIKKTSALLGYHHAVNQYTYAVAFMELPFFAVAHLYEKIRGLPANGYSNTYNIAIIISGLFYSLSGFLLVYRILRYYFKPIHSLLSLGLILLATNMFWFTFRQAGMSHIPLFFLYALMLYLTIKVHARPGRLYFICLGFLAGFITIMRPTDIVCLLIPLLYGVYNKETFRWKIAFIKSNFSSVLYAAVLFILPVIPQALYWHALTGKYIIYSYGSQSFNWGSPKIIDGLFYFNNGWLPYAPVMIFALAGFFLYKQYRPWVAVMATLLPVYIYIIYSWYCYNYINGLGSRPMLHMYPLLALPLTAFIQYVAKKGIIIKVLFTTACLFSAAVIFSLSTLLAQNKFRSEDANVQFYMEMLFRNKVTYKAMLAYDLAEFQPDPAKLTKISTLTFRDFNQPKTEHYVADPNDTTGFVYHMWQDQEYFPDGIFVPYEKEKFHDAKWVRCSGRFMYPDYAENRQQILVFGVLDKSGNYKKWKGCKINTKVGISDNSCPHAGTDSLMIEHTEYWRWSEVYFYTKLPDDLQAGDTICLDIWNMNKKRLFFDDFKIELYK